MIYAIIDNGVVVNTIVGPLPEGINGMPVHDVPVGIGDAYSNGIFLHDGTRILTPLESAEDIIAELDAAILELELANAMLELGM